MSVRDSPTGTGHTRVLTALMSPVMSGKLLYFSCLSFFYKLGIITSSAWWGGSKEILHVKGLAQCLSPIQQVLVKHQLCSICCAGRRHMVRAPVLVAY